MRATDLLGREVLDATGRSLGPVRDMRVTPERLDVVGLVIGGGRLARIAHGWGYAEGRAAGPWLLRALTRAAVAKARLIPIERVVDLDARPLRLTCTRDDLPDLHPSARA